MATQKIEGMGDGYKSLELKKIIYTADISSSSNT